MNSSVYSIGDSLYKKATQFYNDYISRDQNDRIVKDMLQQINHGEIIFSKNNVCIHLTEPYHSNVQSSANSNCNKNCLPGYFSIKLIKSQSTESNELCDNDETRELIRQKNKKTDFEETSFIEKEKFDFNKLKLNDPSNEMNFKSDSNKKTDLDNNTLSNSQKRPSSIYLKRQQTESINDSSVEQEASSYYSMMITWISNLIFEEKPNKLTRNLSLKLTNSNKKPSSNQCLRTRFKSLGQLEKHEQSDDSTDDQTHQHRNLIYTTSYNLNRLNRSLINSRSYSSDTQLNLVSKYFDSFKNTDELVNEESFIFTIDIKKIKSLKLFLGSQMNDNQIGDNCKEGQLVIGNYNHQFKIFHFHNGGIGKLFQFLNDWNFVFYKQKNLNNGLMSSFESLYEESNQFSDTSDSLLEFYRNKFVQLKNQKLIKQENNELSCIQQYSINLPALNYLHLQDECSKYQSLAINSKEEYSLYFSLNGQLIYDFDKLQLRCFFKGCEANSRKYFWPYLLNRFAFHLTIKERNEIKRHGEFLYRNIDEKRRNIKKEGKFYRKFVQYQSTIREDVPRTDRNNKALQEEAKLKQMERILLNYSLYSTKIGYTQGFSDLLAPLVIILKNETESEIFFHFVYLLEKKNLVCLPNDDSIDNCIAKIRELLRLLDFKLYNYFKQLGEQAFQLLFTHRWVLLCFKREFDEDTALRIWESCFSEFQYQFQIFICISIIQIYGSDLVEKKLNSDDILFYFGNLSHKMNATIVMKRARSNLFQFKSLTKLPCTLRSLCTNYKTKLNNPSVWTTQLQPFFECIRSAENPDSLLLCTCDK